MSNAPLPNRRPSATASVGPFAVTVGFDPRTNTPCEIFIVARGKSGTDIDHILYDLGVTASKIMQGEPHE